MKSKMQKFNYDSENDDLFLYNPKSKSKGSVELGDIILDYNTQKDLVGMQIMNASKLIKELTYKDISFVKTILTGLKKCTVDIVPKNNIILIKLSLYSGTEHLSSAIPVPSLLESGPALAEA